MTQEPMQARVIACHGRNHLVEDASGRLLTATRKGKKLDVAVGDFVELSQVQDGSGSIRSVAPRRSLFFRKDALRTKVLAANVDLVLVVYASHPEFNPEFVWRALLAAHASGVPALVLRNKTDIRQAGAKAEAFAEETERLGHTVRSLSALESPEEEIESLRQSLRAKTTLLVGQSGMGKSTLLNRLVPEAGARTQAYSVALNAGRQTTTETRLYPLCGGGAVVDSPGFTHFGLAHLTPAVLQQAMPEFAPHLGKCRFLDCRHAAEPGCAVKLALAQGLISEARYGFYLRMLEELSAKSY